MSDRQLQTTFCGMPVRANQNSLAAGPRSLVSMQEWLMME